MTGRREEVFLLRFATADAVDIGLWIISDFWYLISQAHRPLPFALCHLPYALITNHSRLWQFIKPHFMGGIMNDIPVDG
jgi:hypothetical protein